MSKFEYAKLADAVGAVSEAWNGFAVLHTAASRVGGLDLGFVPGNGGMTAGKMVAKGALDVLLDRLPNLRPDPTVEPARITGLMFRAPDHVWSAWDPA